MTNGYFCMLEGDSPPLLPPEDVVRSVFEIRGNRLSLSEVDAVISRVRSVLTRGCNPVQEESISSSSPSPCPSSSSSSFWFLLSSAGGIDFISEGCLPLLGLQPTELRQKSAFSLVAARDHHIVPPILTVGPCTSMSCRLHFQSARGTENPFDVTFAKLSTKQLISEIDKERSATLCVARAVPVSHGKLTIFLSSNFQVVDIENRSEVSFDKLLLFSRHITDLVAKSDAAVLDTLLEAHSDCSAQLRLHLSGASVGALVRSVHSDSGTVVLHCDINKIESILPVSEPSASHEISVLSNNDRLTELCSTVFNDNDPNQPMASTSLFCPPSPSYSYQAPLAEKPKRARKPRPKKIKTQPEEDSCLKKLLATRPSDSQPDEFPPPAVSSFPEMYAASQSMYMNTGMPMGYPPNHSAYMQVHPGAAAAAEYGMPPQNMHHWPGAAEYYQHQQQAQLAFANSQSQQKGGKRKAASNSDRANKMPYSQTPQFAFSQAGPNPLDPTAMPTMSDEHYLQPHGVNGLSPYRYSPGSSPYWPSGGRPPSRSELVRMELRQSLQAKQMANQQRQHAVEVPAPVSNESSHSSSNSGIGADALGFDFDIVLKDADGSLMDAELDTVFDFKLGGGCGFDMDNESTKCLVMKLLS